MRSSVQPAGRSPISLAKLTNEDSHRAQTVMPRPPYRGYDLWSLFWHRASIFSHERFSPVMLERLYAWRLLCAAARFCAKAKHPQERVRPLFSSAEATVFSPPQSHLHNHLARPAAEFSTRLITVNKPKRRPVKSLMLLTCSVPFGLYNSFIIAQ